MDIRKLQDKVKTSSKELTNRYGKGLICFECGFVVVKDDGKADRKPAQQKQAVVGKDKK